MSPRVTAILVVHHGGERLTRALDAIRAQSRRPERLIVALVQADAETRNAAAEAAPDGIIQIEERIAFGEAVRRAEQTLPPPQDDEDAVWLLSEDTEAEPRALAALETTLETARSVAIAGPKLLDAESPDRIASLGRSMTRLGAAVPLVTAELDQGQHDGLSDVLGVDPGGLLVRRSVWRALEGFDPALPVVDDGLDLAVRARLAGHRVAVVPTAHVRFAAGGLIGPAAGHRAGAVRRRAAATRRAALHRRMSYAPAAATPLHWLSLLPLALLRSIVLLVTKAPGRIVGEFGAALRTMFSFGAVARSRRVLRGARSVGWSAIAPLRIQPDEMRRRRRLEAEERRARARGRVDGVDFLATGGGWVLLVAVVVAIAVLFPLLGAAGVSGPGLLPLSPAVDELWRNASYGWRDVGTGFVGAADPFQAVLAVLGSLAFWAPSWAIVALWLLAIPVSALGAWFAAARLTDRGALRALAAVLWMLSPPLLSSLADGRPGAVLAHVLLAWLLYAALGSATSWATAATASLLFTAVVASAPSLAPALIVAWIVGTVVSGRGAARLALLPIPAVVLAAPVIWAQFAAGNPLALLADPGAPVPAAVPGSGVLALGFTDPSLGGWQQVLASLPASIDPRWVVAALLLPLALSALAAFAVGRLRAATFALAGAALGFATAVAAAQLSLAIVGSTAVPVASAPGQSMMWLGLVLAAVIALDGLRRASAWLAALLTVATAAAVLPLAVSIATGRAEVAAAGSRSLPAFVTAEAENNPRVTTLRLVPESDGGLRATLEHGAGATLDEQSTIAQTRVSMDAGELALAEIAGNLASRGGFDADRAIEEFGISYVLLGQVDEDAPRAAALTADRSRAALDANAALVPVGETDFGTLWRFADAAPDAPAAQIPAQAGAPLTGWIATVQLIVFGAVLLLSIPAGVGREEPGRRPKRSRPARVRRRDRTPPEAETAAAAAATGDPEADSSEGAAADADARSANDTDVPGAADAADGEEPDAASDAALDPPPVTAADHTNPDEREGASDGR
ncbi:glycosyltransferase [Agromyces mediolanus]|uniref:glycosyltransferase n=1 Tax=Agromyces mediolanus TaxID=41986 RepID=UPI00203A841C|nr:glycosyltransferase [Agromyces mediolanus]MCM3656554.1 glycosyltransferase [Agromyces mediolanus]